jgi:hypothetical protein
MIMKSKPLQFPGRAILTSESSMNGHSAPFCCHEQKVQMELLLKMNMNLMHSLREEQNKLKKQERMFERQVNKMREEHKNNFDKMGSLLTIHKKVSVTPEKKQIMHCLVVGCPNSTKTGSN